MRCWTIAAAALASILATQATVMAQSRDVRANERYCLHVNDPDVAGAPLCRFETWEQCMASRISHMDMCILNPRLNIR